MPDKKWTHAAWMAIGAAALSPPNVILAFLADGPMRGRPGVVPIALSAIVFGTAAAVLSIIALYRFRELLNERYDYHGIDTLVTFALVGIVVINIIGIVGRTAMLYLNATPEQSPVATLAFAVPVIALGAALGVVAIITGVRLVGLENDLQHLIRPYGVLSILGGVCFVLVFLAPIGMLLIVAENVILALTFLRAGESEPTVDFV